MTRSVACGEQFLDIVQQRGNLVLDRAPDERVIDEVVAVNEDVAKSDDLPVVADAGGGLRIMLREPPDCFADDLEIPLDRLAEQAVTAVVVDRLASRGVADEGRRVANVLKQFERPGLHRRAGASC